MSECDLILEGLEAFCHVHDVVVEKRGRGYLLLRRRKGAPLARLRRTDDREKVQVLWWNGERWKAPGPIGRLTMPVDQAIDYITSEPAFWIHV